ncbi:MAG: hypothetical protein ABSD20_14005 [Terriglobales bacterium]|jgi:hypothetical protein
MQAPDLITLAQLKQRLGIPSSNTNADADLQALIDQTSQDFHTQLNRASVLYALYNERRNGQGGSAMVLRNDPIISVTALVVGAVQVPAAPLPAAPPGTAGYFTAEGGCATWGCATGYVIDNPSLFIAGGCFARGVGNVLIQYWAGFGNLLTSAPGGWTATSIYTAGTQIVDSNGNLQQCTAGGQSGPSAPGWATTIGASTTDNTVIWQCLGAPALLPQDMVLAVLDWCHHRYVARPGMGMGTRRLASGEGVSYDSRTMPDSVATTIEKYKRRTYPQ